MGGATGGVPLPYHRTCTGVLELGKPEMASDRHREREGGLK